MKKKYPLALSQRKLTLDLSGRYGIGMCASDWLMKDRLLEKEAFFTFMKKSGMDHFSIENGHYFRYNTIRNPCEIRRYI